MPNHSPVNALAVLNLNMPFDTTEQAILDGLANNEFVYYYQPKVSLVTGKVVGAEALIRWLQPDGRAILPDAFIPFAERSSLINEIACRMFDKLCRDLLILSDLSPELVVSFNASALDFKTGRFVDIVLRQMQLLMLPPQSLQVELTETTILEACAESKRHMLALHKAGIGLAMDDYGTGYSTLDTLSQWPFNTIKLDRGIVGRMMESAKSQTIVESSIRMAHELDVKVVAEGVETDKQYQMLLESGCSEVQGFWISKPLPLEDFLYFIQQDLRWSGLPIGLIHMATVDHIQWRKRLVSEVVRLATSGKTEEERQTVNHPELDHRECRLGQWFYGIGQQFKGCADFDAIEQPHRHFHQLGVRLIDMVKSGRDMHDMAPLLSEFSEYSGIILQCLQKLEHQGLLDMHHAHAAWEEHHLFDNEAVC